MASHPVLKAASILESTQVHLLPEGLLILVGGLGSDRVRRILYTDVARASLGLIPRTGYAVVMIILIIVSIVLLIYRVGIPAYCLGLLSAFKLAESVMLGKTVFTIESEGGGKTVIHSVGVTRKKADAFLKTLLDNIAKAQGEPLVDEFPPAPVRDQSTVIPFGEE